MLSSRLASLVTRQLEKPEIREETSVDSPLVPTRGGSPFRVAGAAAPAAREPMRSRGMEPRPRLRVGGICLAIFLGAALATFALVCVQAYRNAHATPIPPPLQSAAAPAAPQSPRQDLGLRIQPADGRLVISWDRDAQLVREAVAGLLLIDDGNHHRKITLDINQVHTGAVLYRPATDDVSLELSLANASGVPVTQTYRVLDSAMGSPYAGSGERGLTRTNAEFVPRAGAIVNGTEPRQGIEGHQTPSVTPAAATFSNPSSLASLTMPKPEELPAPKAADETAAVKGGTGSDAGGSARNQIQSPAAGSSAGDDAANSVKSAEEDPGKGTVLLASAQTAPSSLRSSQERYTTRASTASDGSSAPSPVVQAGNVAQGQRLNAAPSSTRPATIPPAVMSPGTTQPGTGKANGPLPVVPKPGTAKEGGSNVIIGGASNSMTEPKPQRMVNPDASSLRSAAIVEACELRLYLTVDEKGRVMSARPLNSGRALGPELVSASIAAARQWKFVPAQSGGVPVKSHYSIVFKFQPARR